MDPAVVRVTGLPDAPLAAAAAFYAQWLGQMQGAEAELAVVVFAPAGHEHRAWRLAAVQELAREAAPRRVNGIAGNDEGAIGAAIAYLAGAPGVTGQLLAVDGIGARTG